MGKNSRTRTVVKRMGPGASHDEIIEYNQYLMSGCGSTFLFSTPVYYAQLMPDCLDYDVDSEDTDDDTDDENGQLPVLGLSTHSGGQGMFFSRLDVITSLMLARDIHPEFEYPIDSFEKVQQWQVRTR